MTTNREGPFSLTTRGNLLLVAACVVGGVWLYRRGLTYEGSALAYMLGGVIFAYPYYRAQFTPWMTFLVLGSLVPMTIWLQNKGVENQLWHYPAEKTYWLSITRQGEGWWRCTRHVWLGNDMPVMEYLFYPLFGLFHMTFFAWFNHVLPTRWFEQEQRALRHLFLVVMLPLIVVFIGIYFRFPNPNATDYTYWMTGCLGFAATVGSYVLSPNFRRYTRCPAFWIWLVIVGCGFMTAWEFFHVCWNHDWVYDLKNTFPPAYLFRGVGIPFSDFFGYLVTATTFQALMYFFITKFGRIVIRDSERVPFGRVARRRFDQPPAPEGLSNDAF